MEYYKDDQESYLFVFPGNPQALHRVELECAVVNVLRAVDSLPHFIGHPKSGMQRDPRWEYRRRSYLKTIHFVVELG